MTVSPAISGVTPSERAREVFHEIFNERDLAGSASYWSDQSVDHFVALGISARGREELVRFFEELFAAFPDWNLEIEQTVDDGDRRVVVQWTANATFDGARWQGIEPTGSRVTIRGVDVINFDDDGKIDVNTVYYDGASFAREIGMLPPAGSTADRAVMAAFNAATKAKALIRGMRS